MARGQRSLGVLRQAVGFLFFSSLRSPSLSSGMPRRCKRELWQLVDGSGNDAGTAELPRRGLWLINFYFLVDGGNHLAVDLEKDLPQQQVLNKVVMNTEIKQRRRSNSQVVLVKMIFLMCSSMRLGRALSSNWDESMSVISFCPTSCRSGCPRARKTSWTAIWHQHRRRKRTSCRLVPSHRWMLTRV